jgi:hypothetical protein
MSAKLTIRNARLGAAPVYTPANGTNSAKTQLTIMDNGRAYTDRVTGQRVDGKTEVLYITGWNSKNTQPGKRGLADLLTTFAVGSEISCECRVRGYESRVMDPVTKQFMMASNGTELKVRRTEYLVIPGTIIWGKEAQKIIDQEVQTGLRPEAWDGKFYPKNPEEQARAGAEMAQWQQIRQSRNAALYAGGAVYNYAEVKAPAGNAYAPGAAVPGYQAPVQTPVYAPPVNNQPVDQVPAPGGVVAPLPAGQVHMPATPVNTAPVVQQPFQNTGANTVNPALVNQNQQMAHGGGVAMPG